MNGEVTFTLGELAEVLSARLVGDPDLPITGVGSLASAGPGDLSHLSSPTYRDQLADTRAGAVILAERDLDGRDGAALVVANPYLTYARATRLFAREPALDAGVHPSAVIAGSAVIGARGWGIGGGCR